MVHTRITSGNECSELASNVSSMFVSPFLLSLKKRPQKTFHTLPSHQTMWLGITYSIHHVETNVEAIVIYASKCQNGERTTYIAQ